MAAGSSRLGIGLSTVAACAAVTLLVGCGSPTAPSAESGQSSSSATTTTSAAPTMRMTWIDSAVRSALLPKRS